MKSNVIMCHCVIVHNVLLSWLYNFVLLYLMFVGHRYLY